MVQPEALNKKAIQIINRVRDKLTGEFCSSLKHQPLTQKGSKHERKQLYYYYRNEVGIVKLPQVRCFFFFSPELTTQKRQLKFFIVKDLFSLFDAASGLWCRTCSADKSSQTIQKITWVSLIELLESREPHQIEHSGQGLLFLMRACPPPPQVETSLTTRRWTCQRKWSSSSSKPRRTRTCASATSDGQCCCSS